MEEVGISAVKGRGSLLGERWGNEGALGSILQGGAEETYGRSSMRPTVGRDDDLQ